MVRRAFVTMVPDGLLRRVLRGVMLSACFVGLAWPVCAAPSDPATVPRAAEVVDMRSLETLDGATFPAGRNVAQLAYEASGKVAEAYAFHEQALVKNGWAVLPGGYQSEQMASGTLTKSGFKLSLSVMPSGPAGKVRVSIINHGNVDTGQLPTPSGSVPFYGSPVSTAYLVSQPVAEVAQELRATLAGLGWQPYGQAGDVAFYKRNAVLLKVRVASAPAQAGKTMVDYSTEQMSADLPAPPDASRVQYAESTKELSFDVSTPPDDVEAFYRRTLTAAGWKATTERAVQERFESFVVFRNAERDMATLTMRTVDQTTRGRLRFMTAEEVAAQDERAPKAPPAMAEAEPPGSRRVKIVLPMPAGARNVEVGDGSIEFELPAGKGRAAVESLRKHFRGQGWKEESVALEKIAGNVTLASESSMVTMTFVDTGLESARITVMCLGGELVRGNGGD